MTQHEKELATKSDDLVSNSNTTKWHYEIIDIYEVSSDLNTYACVQVHGQVRAHTYTHTHIKQTNT